MKNNAFLAGQEEIFARIISLILSTLFYLIYTLAVAQISLNYQSVIVFIFVFWVIYESLSLILFQIFTYFSNKNIQPTSSETEISKSKPNSEILPEDDLTSK